MNNTNKLQVLESISDDIDNTKLLLKPIAPIDNIVEAYKEYNLLKSRLLSDNDYQVIRWKKYIKKSGFRKLSTAFGISTQVVKEERLNFAEYFVYEITVRAIASNWRFTEACSSCASNERTFSHQENDTRATAQTRASNRAIADLIWSWEVSAEEIYSDASKQDSSTVSYDTNEYMIQEQFYNEAELEESDPDNKDSVIIKNNKTYSWDELMTVKQKNLLVKLIETKYQDEKTRSWLFQKLNFLTKKEAWDAIKKMLWTAKYSYS